MSLTHLSAPEMAHHLHGFGINLLVRHTHPTTQFLHQILRFRILRHSPDYAVLSHRRRLYQLHADPTYATHPLLAHLPEAGLRGAGIELRLYRTNPDQAEHRARAAGHTILQPSTDKPHGLRECYLLDPDGYCWVPCTPI